MDHAQRVQTVERLRSMGATRFSIRFHADLIPQHKLHDNPLAAAVTELVEQDLMRRLQSPQVPLVALTWPDIVLGEVDVADVSGLSLSWLENALLPPPRPTPILVIQYALEPQHWLYLAAPIADPYFISPANPFSLDRIAWQLLTLLLVLLPTLWVVRGLIRPIEHIAAAAKAFGSASVPEPIAETGTAELRRTARAFNEMLARIQGYLVDRERLFVGISHSLKTPIMRLKLRTELLEDEELRAEFHEDLDDLDVMVKSALQSLRDTDIHENLVAVRLDLLLARLVRRPIAPDAGVSYTALPIQVQGKPLALERAYGNLIDNAILYGQQVEVRLSRLGNMAMVEIRDFGPGIPAASMAAAFEPHIRLSHGKNRHRGGTGLGLGIAKNIVQAHKGEIRLHNHIDGGLVVTVLLPALYECAHQDAAVHSNSALERESETQRTDGN